MDDFRAFVVLAVVALAAIVACAEAATPVKVFRLLQAEYQGQKIGSKHYSADGHLTLPLPNSNTFKSVIVLPVNTTTPEVLAAHTQQKSSLSGVLLVLLSSLDSAALPAAEAKNLLQLEQQLRAAPAAVPVFFTKETADLAAAVEGTKAMFERSAPPTKQTDRFEVRIQGKLPSQLVSKQAINYVASLKATDDQFKPGVPVAPTLLITAHYDSFSLAPAAPAGADTAASGAAACLLLLRLLHRMYTSPETRPQRNIAVLLTSGGPYGQQGLQQWAADVDPAQLEAIDAAVVLDSIGASAAAQQQSSTSSASASSSARQLHLHHAGGSSTGGSWVEAVSAAAGRMGLPLTAVKEDLPANSEATAAYASWGHEHLVRKGVPAVSISYLAAAPTAAPRISSLGDTAAGVNLDKVLDAAQVTADAVTRWLYPHLDPQLRLLDLKAAAEQHRDFLAGWIELLSTTTSMLPFDKADPAGSVLFDSLHQFMRGHSHSTKRHVWSPAGTPADITAWGGAEADMQVYQVAGYVLDMALTAASILYLGGLYVGLMWLTRGWNELAAMWSPRPTRRTSRSGSSKRFS